MTFIMTSSIDNKGDIVNFFMKTCSVLSIQYMYKIHVKSTKVRWDTACFFHHGPTKLPQSWDFQKSPAQVGLRFIETSTIVLIIGTMRICTCANNYWKCVNNKCLRVLILLCFCIYFTVSLKENIILETLMMGCDFTVVASYWVQLY